MNVDDLQTTAEGASTEHLFRAWAPAIAQLQRQIAQLAACQVAPQVPAIAGLARQVTESYQLRIAESVSQVVASHQLRVAETFTHALVSHQQRMAETFMRALAPQLRLAEMFTQVLPDLVSAARVEPFWPEPPQDPIGLRLSEPAGEPMVMVQPRSLARTWDQFHWQERFALILAVYIGIMALIWGARVVTDPDYDVTAVAFLGGHLQDLLAGALGAEMLAQLPKRDP